MPYSVLIVDDKIDVRETLQDLLIDFECSFAEAESAEEALICLACTAFDVIFLDVKLPGISGIEMLREAREQMPDLGPVIVLTGFPDEKTRQEATSLGAIRYLSKTPLNREDVRRAFAAAVDHVGSEDDVANHKGS